MNGFKRTLLLIISFPIVSQAVNVRWGSGMIDAPDSYSGVPYYQWSFGIMEEQYISCANFFFEKSDYSYGVRMTSVNFALAAYGSAFALMNEGDVVDAASMATGNLFSDPYGMVNGNTVYDITIPIRQGRDVYLGFVTDVYMDDGSFDVRTGYGWVKFRADLYGGLYVDAAAIDLDGGPMIVGGGAYIPEPHSALLLFVGCALLALKRRQL
jgi:hypothetical protein